MGMADFIPWMSRREDHSSLPQDTSMTCPSQEVGAAGSEPGSLARETKHALPVLRGAGPREQRTKAQCHSRAPAARARPEGRREATCPGNHNASLENTGRWACRGCLVQVQLDLSFPTCMMGVGLIPEVQRSGSDSEREEASENLGTQAGGRRRAGRAGAGAPEPQPGPASPRGKIRSEFLLSEAPDHTAAGPSCPPHPSPSPSLTGATLPAGLPPGMLSA